MDVEINVLLKRLRNTKKRPLLFKKNIRDTVNKIYLERKKTYSEADYRIRCSYLKPELIINKMLKLYENTKISFKNKKDPYTVCIGQNILSLLPKKSKKFVQKQKKLLLFLTRTSLESLKTF